jgi:hypothetical protein
MSVAAGLLNLALGVVYLQYGTITFIEMRRNWSRMGFSHFGAAWIAMAFTCGPHHMTHGIHILFEGRSAGVLDLIAVAVGAPAGVIWFRLRVEAFLGGRGDRHIAGTPAWVCALPTLLGMYFTAMVAAALAAGPPQWDRVPTLLPNLLLVVLYGMVAFYVTRTQIANRRPLGGWSVSGMSLGIIFWTCAVMHATYALYTLTDRYGFDVHGFTIDVLAVPAACYFVTVVRALQRGTFRDWNSVSRALDSVRTTAEAEAEPVAVAAR